MQFIILLHLCTVDTAQYILCKSVLCFELQTTIILFSGLGLVVYYFYRHL